MNVLGLLKTVGGDVLKVVQFGAAIERMPLVNSIVSALPGGAIASSALKLLMHTSDSIVGTEAAFKDVKSASANKQQSVVAAVDNYLQAYEDVAAMRGETFSYDEDSLKRLVDKQLTALDELNTFRASFKFTKK